MSSTSNVKIDRYWDDDERSLTKMSYNAKITSDESSHIPITDILKQYYRDIDPHNVDGIEVETKTTKKTSIHYLQKHDSSLNYTNQSNDNNENGIVDVDISSTTFDSDEDSDDDIVGESNSHIIENITYKYQWYS